ncbi:MAG: hypothetical protein AABY26_04595 [Nanoarchaeota archaeon]
MLEEKIEKSLLGKISGALRRNFGVYLLAGGLAMGGIYGCGKDTEPCSGNCPSCSGNKTCSCSQPKGTDDCSCSCSGSSCETADYGICCQAGLCYSKSDFEGIDEVE